jgi:hypothetical protein
MKPDFNVMTKAELRSYVLSHREDQEAFQALAKRFQRKIDKVKSVATVKHRTPES